MLLTPHVLVGITVSSFFKNPYLAVSFALISHFLADLVPHWDFFTGTENSERKHGWRIIAIMADFGLAIFLGTFFTLRELWVFNNPSRALVFFLAGIFAVLPDALEAPYVFMDKTPLGTKHLIKIQRKLQTRAGIYFGTITQLIACAVCAYLLSNLS